MRVSLNIVLWVGLCPKCVTCLVPYPTVYSSAVHITWRYPGSEQQSLCDIWGNLTTVTWPNFQVCGYKYEENSGYPAGVCYKSFFTKLLCSCNSPNHYVVCKIMLWKVVLAYFLHHKFQSRVFSSWNVWCVRKMYIHKTEAKRSQNTQKLAIHHVHIFKNFKIWILNIC
jgi:hypothetical protein